MKFQHVVLTTECKRHHACRCDQRNNNFEHFFYKEQEQLVSADAEEDELVFCLQFHVIARF